MSEDAQDTDSEWEVFTARHAQAAKAPILSVQQRLNATLNTSAAQLLGDTEAFEVLYSRQRNRLGFRPASSDQPHVYPMRRVGTARTALMSLSSVINHYQLTIGPGDRFVGHMEGDILVFDLNERAGDLSEES